MARAAEITLAHVDVQRDFATIHRGEAVRVDHQLSCHQREQVAGLGPGIVPLGPMRAVLALARCFQVPVAQQHRKCLGIAAHGHAVGGKDIGPVGKEGNATEPLRLALGAQHPVRSVKAHQLGVGRGIDLRRDPDLMRLAWQGHEEIAPVHRPAVAEFTVYGNRDYLQSIAVQANGGGGFGLGVARYTQGRNDARCIQPKIEVEADFGHQPGKGLVILAPDGGRFLRRARSVGEFGVAIGGGGCACDIHHAGLNSLGLRVECLERTTWRICSFLDSVIRQNVLRRLPRRLAGKFRPPVRMAIWTFRIAIWYSHR